MSDEQRLFDGIRRNAEMLLVRGIEKARDEVIKVNKSRSQAGKRSDGADFSPYSERHKMRRSKEGLQTSRKDLRYSETLFENLKETNRSWEGSVFTIIVSFDGQAARRADQMSATNVEVAGWLSQQEDFNIIGVSSQDRQKINEIVAAEFTRENLMAGL